MYEKYDKSSGKYVYTREGGLHSDVLKRCYSKAEHKRYPRYIGCEATDEVKDFQSFASWCNKQIGLRSKDHKGNSWHLDKDILFKGNKLYSFETMVFVPAEVNIFLTKSNAARRSCPIGVSWHSRDKCYEVYCCNPISTGRDYLGRFDCPEKAFYVYKAQKELLSKALAEKYRGVVDDRVVEALINYTVEITD